MSDRWPGGIIRKTPVVPTGPSDTGSAPGIWTMDQASYWIKQGLWPTQLIRDPYFPYVTMLLGTTSLNGAQNNTFLDSSTNNYTITRSGNTTQGSFSPYGSSWSNYFDGSGDFLSVPDNAALDFETGNFTVEMWVYFPSTVSSNNALIAGWTTGEPVSGWVLGADGTNFYFGSAVSTVYSTFAVNTAARTPGTWHHVAAVRSSGNVTVYVNGVGGTPVSNTQNITTAATGLNIGRSPYTANPSPFTGYISNLRIVKGTAVYTSNFTPPTQPLTAISGTSLLTCQSNRFLDASTNNFTITRNGDTIVTNFSPFAPSAAYSTSTNGGSGYFDGNDYLYIDSTAAPLTLGTGDFTIECWVYQRNLSGAQSWVSTYNGPSAGYIFGYDGGTRFSWGDNYVVSSATTVTPGMWNHMAVTRSGTTARLFKNGVEIGSSTDSTNLTGGVGTTMGMIPTYNQWFLNGWLSDVRIVKGTALYTSAFTPPTTPLTVISNTSMLSSFTNAGIFDNSTKNDFETFGNAQVSTTQAKFGTTSSYFDGSGDYLFMPNTPNLAFGTGNFTIELWAYIAGNSVVNPEGNRNAAMASSINASSPTGIEFNLLGNGSVTGTGLSFGNWVGGTQYLISGSTSISQNAWHHFAVVRNGTTTTLYVDGTSIGSGTLGNQTINPALPLQIGQQAHGSFPHAFNGYIDDFRITKGIARYTSNFTPPTAAFPTA